MNGEMILDKNNVPVEKGMIVECNSEDGSWIVLGYDEGRLMLAELGDGILADGDDVEIKN
jgi:hypothetical protein